MTTQALHPSLENAEGKKVSNEIASLVFIISLAMLFATLFLGFAFYRFTATVWPPAGFQRPSLINPLISTFWVISASVWGEFFYRQYFKKVFSKTFYFLALGSAIAFLISQCFLWSNLKNTGLLVDAGIYPSMLHAFTWVHAAHVVTAVFAWFFPLRENRMIINFWHFLTLIWLLMFVILFLI
jgi:cytochrome c oxidase subunit 3